jgi:RNA polymerase sigma-70 factor (ECF subfamily)
MQRMGDTSELVLLEAWRAGDRSAGDTLMRSYYERVLGFFRLRVPDAADDLTQRTFLACTEGRERFEPTSFPGFLFGIARRQLYRHFEKNRLDTDLHFRGAAPQSVLTPSGVVALRQEHSLLLRAFEMLTMDQQTMLALFYIQGLKSREIAEALEIPVSTVTSRVARAREALRSHVATLPAPARAREALAAELESWVRSLATLTSEAPG